MHPNCKRVIENLSLHQNPDLTHREKADLKEHLVECPICQKEHEEMLHAVAVLESLSDPIPPMDLVEQTQARIIQEHQRLRLAFFASPIARLLDVLKLGPHPIFVNCTALVFYLMLTVFLVKLTFFSPTDPASVNTAGKSFQSPAPIAKVTYSAKWGSMKTAAVKTTMNEEEKPKEVTIEPK
jgi:hypothetical protein